MVRRAQPREMDRYCRDELLRGPCLLAGVGYFRYSPFDCDTGRLSRDWQLHRDSLLRAWGQPFPCFAEVVVNNVALPEPSAAWSAETLRVYMQVRQAVIDFESIEAL